MGLYTLKETIHLKDGSIEQINKFKSVRRSPENYFSLYISGFNELLSSINSLIELKLFLALCSKAKFNENTISLNKQEKTELAGLINCNLGTLNNALSKLVKKQFLERNNGNFTIPIKYFWKGDSKIRNAKIGEVGKAGFETERESFLRASKA